MNPNTTPTSESQDDQVYRPQFPQQYPPQYSQQYPPNFSQQYPPNFPQQYPPNFSQQYPPHFVNSMGQTQQIPYQLTRAGMIEHGCVPTMFNPSSPIVNIADDYVPETQPSTPNTPQSIPTQQSNPGPGPSNPKRPTKAAKQAWTKAEEIALVSAWVDVSEDPVVGNAQTGGNFWGRIMQSFFTRLGREPYRSSHQLNSKFNELNKRINWFGGIYNNLLNNRSSGMSEADISRTAHERYVAQHGVSFTHEQAWDILKKCPKWGAVPTMTTSSRGSKRTTSDDDGEQLQRPIGRNKAKKASTNRSTGPNSSEGVSDEFLVTLQDTITDTKTYKMKKLDLEQKKFEQEIEEKRSKRFEKDFEFFTTPHDHLTGPALTAVLVRKEQIRQFHGW